MAAVGAVAAAGAAAAAAYLDAKFHIRHDLTTPWGGPIVSTKYAEDCIAKDRLLLNSFLDDQVRVRPNSTFLINEGRTWTYKQFYDSVQRAGNWLINDLGVQRDEVVAIDGTNSAEWLIIEFAVLAIGGVVAMINYNLTGNALMHCVKIGSARYLLTDSDVKHLVSPVHDELASSGVTVVYYDRPFIDSLTNSTPVPESRRKNISPISPRLLMFTSGTTGLPKAIIMQAIRIVNTTHVVTNQLGLTSADRMYTCLPLYHGTGHGLCVLPTLYAGGSVFLSRKFSHKTFWPEIRESKANIVQYIGELCRYLLNAPPSPLDGQHNVQMAWGNGLRPDVWEPFRQRFKIPVIHELYAATDGLVAMTNVNRGQFTHGAIGRHGLLFRLLRPDGCVPVRIDPDTEDVQRDPSTGFATRCKPGEAGEVLTRVDPAAPRALFAGYFGNEDASDRRYIRDVFTRGDIWFRSGDVLRRDADGRIFFVDRLGDTFRWRSENVSTAEVADAIGSHPHVAEATVYGVSVPHADGRAGCAALVLPPGIDRDSVDWAGLGRHALASLPRYAVPIFLRLTSALDYTGTMKIQKGRLKKEGIDLGALTDPVYWMPPGRDVYVPYAPADWDAIRSGSVKL